MVSKLIIRFLTTYGCTTRLEKSKAVIWGFGEKIFSCVLSHQLTKFSYQNSNSWRYINILSWKSVKFL